jgi:hypothetical protein
LIQGFCFMRSPADGQAARNGRSWIEIRQRLGGMAVL